MIGDTAGHTTDDPATGAPQQSRPRRNRLAAVGPQTGTRFEPRATIEPRTRVECGHGGVHALDTGTPDRQPTIGKYPDSDLGVPNGGGAGACMDHPTGTMAHDPIGM